MPHIGSVFAWAFLLLGLASCSGGDGGGSSADAGSSRTVRVGETIQIDGSGSRGTDFSWTLARKPATSRAELECASSPVATLAADAPGRYEVELNVDGERDTAVVQVQPTYTLTAIDTRVVSGDGSSASDYAMQIGAQMLAAPALPDGTANGIHVVALDRLTQEVMANLSYPISTAPDLQALIAAMNASWGMTADNLVLISGMALAQPPNQDFAQIVNVFGGGDDVELTGAFSVIGVRGLLPYQGHESVRGEQPLRGYLTLDTSGHYSFVLGDYLTYDTRAASTATSNTIRIGTTSFEASLPSGAVGGFQMVVVPRFGPSASVAPSPCPSGAVCPQQFTFATHAASAEEEANAMYAMSAAITGIVGDEKLIAFIASIGDPLPLAGAQSAAFETLRRSISLIGGNPFVLDRMAGHVVGGTQNYSLIGAASPPPITSLPQVLATEASFTTVSCGPSQPSCADLQAARLVGTLGKNRRNLFEPRAASPISDVELDLYQIAYQAPQPWPVTGASAAPAACGSTPNPKAPSAVFTYLSQLLLGTSDADADIRAQYPNEQFSSLYAGCLSLGSNPSSCVGPRTSIPAGGPKFPGSREFERSFGVRVEEAEFNRVKEELNAEFGDVTLVLGRFTLITSLIDQANANLGDIIDTVAVSTFRRPPPPPQPPHVGISWSSIVSDVLGVFSSFISIGVPGANGVFGVIHGTIDIGCDLMRSSGGAPSQYSSGKVDVLADEQAWREEAATNFSEMQSGVQAVAGLILSDWGKLQAVGDRLAQPETYPGWVWSEGASGTTAVATQAYTVSMAREYYGQGVTACAAINYGSNLGAVYVQDPPQSESTAVLYSSGSCTLLELPDSMNTLQVLEPAQACDSFPCPLGVSTVDFFFRLYHAPQTDCCGCGQMVECLLCCNGNACFATTAPDFPC